LLKNPSAIEDPRLRREVHAAVAADMAYGPAVDVSRRMAGLEYEMVLQQELRARRIPFVSEVRRSAALARRVGVAACSAFVHRLMITPGVL
jgi:hypothetical protein